MPAELHRSLLHVEAALIDGGKAAASPPDMSAALAKHAAPADRRSLPVHAEAPA